MIEYGVFNPEGCIEAQMYGLEEANEAAQRYRDEGDDDVEVKVVCPTHEGQPNNYCEECAAEDED